MIVTQRPIDRSDFIFSRRKTYRISINSANAVSQLKRVLIISSDDMTTGKIEEIVSTVLETCEIDYRHTIIVEHCGESPLFEETFDLPEFDAGGTRSSSTRAGLAQTRTAIAPPPANK